MIYKNVNGTQKLVTNIRKPKKWRRFEYLLSSGTLWIDTGVYGYMNHTYEIIFLQVDAGNYRTWGVFGQSSYIGYNMSFTYASNWALRWESTSSGLALINNIATKDTTKHTIRIANGACYFDGVSKGTSTGHNANFSISYNLYLFTINPANTTPTTNTKCKIYEYKDIDISGNLIRHLVPCQYNGQYGMWDLVEDKFYGNKGTGTFTVGPEIPNYDEIEKLVVPTIDRDALLQYHLPDTITYTEPDGSKWLRIFHHNNPASKIFTSSDTFATYVYKDEDRWFNVALCNKLSSWEFLVKLKLLSTDNTVYQYRWSQSKNPMTATFDDVARANVTYNTNGYNTTTYGGLYKKNSNAYLTANNSASSAWWGAAGAWTRHLSGIPAWNTQVVKSGYMDLYVRIDNQPLKEIPIWVLKNALIKSSSNGTYDYIDTGVNNYTMNNIRCICEMTPLNGEDNAFFGSRGSYYLFYKVSDNYFWPTSKCETIQGTLVVGHKYLVDWNKGTLTVTGDDGVYLKGVRSSTANNTQNLYIFTHNPKDSRTTEAKIHWFKIYINDVLVRDFVPATMGGRPGLYDKVNNKMYFNANSNGNFTVE